MEFNVKSKRPRGGLLETQCTLRNPVRVEGVHGVKKLIQGGSYEHRHQRSDWIKELKDQGSVTAVKVRTEQNLADLFTKIQCHTVHVPVRKRLQQELEELVAGIATRKSAKIIT